MAFCKYMKMITLPKLRDSLRDMKFEVKVPAEIAERRHAADRAHGRDRLADRTHLLGPAGSIRRSCGGGWLSSLTARTRGVASLAFRRRAPRRAQATVSPGSSAAPGVDLRLPVGRRRVGPRPQRGGQLRSSDRFCGGSLITSRIVITAGHCRLRHRSRLHFGLSRPATPGGDPRRRRHRAGSTRTTSTWFLGRTTLIDAQPGRRASASRRRAVRIELRRRLQGDGVPRFDVGYLVLTRAFDTDPDPHRRHGRGRSGTPGHGGHQRLGHYRDSGGQRTDTLPGGDSERRPRLDLHGDYGSTSIRPPWSARGFQSGGGHLRRATAAGRSRRRCPAAWLPAGRNHEAGARRLRRPVCPGVYTRDRRDRRCGRADRHPDARRASESTVRTFRTRQLGLRSTDVRRRPASAQHHTPVTKCKRIRDTKHSRRCVKKVGSDAKTPERCASAAAGGCVGCRAEGCWRSFLRVALGIVLAGAALAKLASPRESIGALDELRLRGRRRSARSPGPR